MNSSSSGNKHKNLDMTTTARAAATDKNYFLALTAAVCWRVLTMLLLLLLLLLLVTASPHQPSRGPSITFV